MQSALSDFKKELDRIDKVADWLQSPVALAPEMNAATWAIRCGSVVLMSGYFESFIKDCMCCFITSVNGMGQPLTKLHKLKLIHFRNGSRALDKQFRRDKDSGDMGRCEDLASRLASVSAATGYTLAWEAFADTQANPGPNVVAELLSATGITDAWTKLRLATPTGLVDLNLWLTTFIEMRNECAHSGNTASPPTASGLVQYRDNFIGLANAMITVLDNRLLEIAAL